MGKQQVWSMTAYVFLFLSLVSQIHCKSQKHFLNHHHEIRLLSLQTTTNGVSQENLKEKDLIQNLPGQPSVSFKQYGGYVPANERADRFLYYYFVEAINANASTPVVIWFNGGPACSSLTGAFTELGPFRIHSDGKTLYRNDYSWNNEANILFLETPTGVGFSYSNTPLDQIKEGREADKRTAEENYMFLVNWLERFPEYKGRELYISGQSYAGHYVPQLAQLIIRRNNQTFINLRGILIGNPRLHQEKEIDGEFQFMVGHGMMPKEYFHEFLTLCKLAAAPGDDCMNTIVKITQIRQKVDQYSAYNPTCQNYTSTDKPKESNTALEYDPCSSKHMKTYLNIKMVQEAMHANTTNIPYPWSSCSKPLFAHWNQTDGRTSMHPILHELMGKGVRVWVYSGDVDLALPAISTMTSLKSMNLTVEDRWRAWGDHEGEVGGFTEDYKENLKYVTVRGAGHNVPTDQPIRALALFTYFLRNASLPTINTF